MTTENIAFHTPCSEGVYLFISLPARHVTFATLSESRRMGRESRRRDPLFRGRFLRRGIILPED